MPVLTKAIEPDGEVYVIGDIHGCYSTLVKLLKKLSFGKKDCIYLPGDMIDRGADSKKVVDLVMSLQRQNRARPLKGNHEDILLAALLDKKVEEHWVTRSGGQATLDSFGVASVHDIPAKYLNWFKSLPHAVKLAYSDGITYVVSHAGVKLTHKKPFRNTATNVSYMLWNRDKHGTHPSMINIVGHTPKSLGAIRESVNHSTIYVDGNCYGGGYLVAFDPNTHDIITVKNAESS